MSVGALVVSLFLLSQVGTGGGRYSDARSTNPFGQNAATNAAAEGGADAGQTPFAAPATSGGGATPATAPGTGPTSPYATSAAATGGGAFPQSPASGPPSPPSGSNPWITSGASAAAGQNASSSGMKPSAMMRAMLAPPPAARLPGSSISLADAVASAASRAEQTTRVEAYWDLCSSVADYYLGVMEQGEFARLRSRVPRVGAAWQQAESELAVRVGTSQRAAIASQHRLASLMDSPGFLPLPSDAPHCAGYNAKYEEIFAGRPSAEAQQLAALLPLRFAELKAAAQAVIRSQEELEATVSRSDNTDGVESLRALELLALRRRAFVQIARDYNRRIARYTELTAPGQVPSSRLVSMLIFQPAPATATRTSSPSSDGRQSQVKPSLPRTFDDEGWTPASSERPGNADRDEAIRQASGELNSDSRPRRERSLLVKPAH